MHRLTIKLTLIFCSSVLSVAALSSCPEIEPPPKPGPIVILECPSAHGFCEDSDWGEGL